VAAAAEQAAAAERAAAIPTAVNAIALPASSQAAW